MKKTCLAVAALSAALAGGAGAQPPEPSPMDRSVQISFRQSEARSMLAEINAFRTTGEPWHWNETDTEKVKVTGLKPFEYDYALERVAMQRAVELILSFAHVRPDGTSCFTAYGQYDYKNSACGENIAAGQKTADDVFVAWREDDFKYEGQGHRRNMLAGNFNRIGIACVVFDGRKYWVQEFAASKVREYLKPVEYSEKTLHVSPNELKKEMERRSAAAQAAANYASVMTSDVKTTLSAYLSAAQQKNFATKFTAEEQNEFLTLIPRYRDKENALAALKDERAALIADGRRRIAAVQADPAQAEAVKAEALAGLKALDEAQKKRTAEIEAEYERKCARYQELMKKLN